MPIAPASLRTNSGSYSKLAAAFVHTVKTASIGSAVQIVHSSRSELRDIKRIGSADDTGLEVLRAAA